jgi:peptidoglycan/LPS O-acetylase OafA/YrhL
MNPVPDDGAIESGAAIVRRSTSAPAKLMDGRIAFLDGLRGIAIFWVILFHAYVRWPEIVPFGNRFSGVPYVAYGWLGVQLFFLISGFVIFMTLEKSADFRDFMSRRWLRLFPAMLLCSMLIFATAPFFHERPAGVPALRDLLPGLTFVDPTWWELIFDSPQGVLEGAFWSLFVEMKFYLIAGSLFFLIGGGRMIMALTGLFIIARVTLLMSANHVAVDLHQLPRIMDLLSAKYFGWFAAGALYYRYFHERKPGFLWLAILTALASALSQDGYQYHPEIFALSVVILFTAAIVSGVVQRLLTNRIFLFFGFVSYPLYLVHENMMVSAIAKVGFAAPWLPAFLMPVAPILLVSGVAWLVAAYAEPRLRDRLRPLLRRTRPIVRELPNV